MKGDTVQETPVSNLRQDPLGIRLVLHFESLTLRLLMSYIYIYIYIYIYE